jgi:prepilin-type processing-associated H-X9-DG protein
MSRTVPLILSLALAAAPTWGAENPQPAARAKAAAFIDDQTVALIRLDLDRLDVDALWAPIARIGGQAMDADFEELTKEKQLVSAWLAGLVKAGADELYLSMDLTDLPDDPPFAFVPLADGANARAIAGLLASGRADGPASWQPGRQRLAGSPLSSIVHATAQMHGAMVGGSRAQLERIRQAAPVPRPELGAAFAAAGDAAVQVLLLPTADTRRVIEELRPTLPAELGGGPSTTLTRGVMWAAVGLDTRPKLSLRVVIQSQDAASAKAFSATLEGMYAALAKSDAVRKHLPEIQKLTAALTPAVSGDHLTLALDDKQLDAVISDLLGPPLRAARARAIRVNRLRRIGHILATAHAYANQHKGNFPPNLEALVGAKMIPASYLRFPLPATATQPAREVGLVYIQPPPLSQISRPSETVVLYEAYDVWGDGINVGFADGHAMFIRGEAWFKKLLADSKAISAPKGPP